jgi:hypothetical protein
VKLSYQGFQLIALMAGEGNKARERCSRLAGNQMFDLAGVGFGDILVNRKNFDEEGLDDSTLREDAFDKLLSFSAEPETMILPDINEPVVFERSQLKRDRRPRNVKPSSNIHCTGGLRFRGGIPDREKIVCDGVTDLVGLELLPNALKISHGTILRPMRAQSQIGLPFRENSALFLKEISCVSFACCSTSRLSRVLPTTF